jgi:hypothetical protein
MPTIRILGVHGVGDHHTDLAWEADWQNAVRAALQRWDSSLSLDFDFLLYDDLFEQYPLDPATYAEAVYALSASAVSVGVQAVDNKVSEIGAAIGGAVADAWNRVGGWLHPSRGITDLPAELRWTAGMVAQWAENDRLRADARMRLTDKLNQYQPDLILAHSLGTLIGYDTFCRDQNLLAGRTLVVFGSQIANPFVRSAFGGRIASLDKAKSFYQLYNPDDRAFAAPIDLPGAGNFTRVLTEFSDGFLSHDAVHYLSHPAAAGGMWQFVALSKAKVFAPVAKTLVAAKAAARTPNRRALLVGINQYSDPQNRLDGCVNDAFLISAALQESGFEPEEIRLVCDDRATAAGILDRLHWLLDDTAPGDQRMFFYSGHGAQMPSYGPGAEVDRLKECLCPYDFDWSEARAITDAQFLELYSQLPYDSHFVAIFDCCHSGGMVRASGAKVRGMTPPDDVRHRQMQWNWRLQMWEDRVFEPVTPDKSLAGKGAPRRQAFVGRGGATERMGRAIPLRGLSTELKKKEQKAMGHQGPFMPVVVEACREDQLSYEYRHGVTSYGAFTFAFAKTLSQFRMKHRRVTFEQLVESTTKQLRELRYEQTPCLVGPTAVISKPVPWHPSKSVGAKTG